MNDNNDLSPASSNQGPLSGLLVLDLSRTLVGPYAMMILGDIGADAINVEHPQTGDETRMWEQPFITTADGREATYFLAANRNKRSNTIDLKDPGGRSFIEDLVRRSSVPRRMRRKKESR
ncbi:MAG TPA: CoA transferase [Acidimicrobiales bacterium]|nr:CoA transferase [Acidimicrobiales bacterium]